MYITFIFLSFVVRDSEYNWSFQRHNTKITKKQRQLEGVSYLSEVNWTLFIYYFFYHDKITVLIW